MQRRRSRAVSSLRAFDPTSLRLKKKLGWGTKQEILSRCLLIQPDKGLNTKSRVSASARVQTRRWEEPSSFRAGRLSLKGMRPGLNAVVCASNPAWWRKRALALDFCTSLTRSDRRYDRLGTGRSPASTPCPGWDTAKQTRENCPVQRPLETFFARQPRRGPRGKIRVVRAGSGGGPVGVGHNGKGFQAVFQMAGSRGHSL